MRFRSRLHLAALSLLIAGAVACTEESPLLTGDPFFPDGRPVTVETLIPADQFLTLGGTFTGYSSARSVPYSVVANSFEGGVTARTLLRFPTALPKEIEFTVAGAAMKDSLYRVTGIELVLQVDSSASQRSPVPVSVHPLTERWDDSIVSWTRRAADSLGTYDWSQPGGTFQPTAWATGTYQPADSGHVRVMAIDTSHTATLRDSLFPGLLVQATQANTMLQLEGAVLRVTVDPSNTDSTVVLSYNAGAENIGLIYTPEAPLPSGLLAAGTVRSTRTLFSIDMPDSLEACTPTCVRLATRDVALHHVSLLLRPQAAGGGYRLLDSARVSLRTVAEPELGRLAPLGEPVVSGVSPTGRGVPSQTDYFATDTVVELPITLHAARMISGDSVQSDFALLGSQADVLGFTPFSLLLFDAAPRLRIVFTVPERPGLP